jgi:hypothetical protein
MPVVIGDKEYRPGRWVPTLTTSHIKAQPRQKKEVIQEPGPPKRPPIEPPILRWAPPPAPKSKGTRKTTGHSATGATNTLIGDLGEMILTKLGLKSLLPAGRRQNPLDVVWGEGNIAFEVKTLTTEASEYKIKMKKSEVESKRKYAKENGYKPGVIILVLDLDNRAAHVYWREGIGNYRLTPKSRLWNYMGSVSKQ